MRSLIYKVLKGLNLFYLSNKVVTVHKLLLLLHPYYSGFNSHVCTPAIQEESKKETNYAHRDFFKCP